jgi:hypothetical protein
MKDYAPCQQMWCGERYFSNPDVLFHVKQRAIDKDGNGNGPVHQQ